MAGYVELSDKHPPHTLGEEYWPLLTVVLFTGWTSIVGAEAGFFHVLIQFWAQGSFPLSASGMWSISFHSIMMYSKPHMLISFLGNCQSRSSFSPPSSFSPCPTRSSHGSNTSPLWSKSSFFCSLSSYLWPWSWGLDLMALYTMETPGPGYRRF